MDFEPMSGLLPWGEFEIILDALRQKARALRAEANQRALAIGGGGMGNPIDDAVWQHPHVKEISDQADDIDRIIELLSKIEPFSK